MKRSGRRKFQTPQVPYVLLTGSFQVPVALFLLTFHLRHPRRHKQTLRFFQQHERNRIR